MYFNTKNYLKNNYNHTIKHGKRILVSRRALNSNESVVSSLCPPRAPAQYAFFFPPLQTGGIKNFYDTDTMNR
jgi:hypothetical protein